MLCDSATNSLLETTQFTREKNAVVNISEKDASDRVLKIIRIDNEVETVVIRTSAALCTPPITPEPCILHELKENLMGLIVCYAILLRIVY